jgi:hypothetical protein
LLLFAPWLNFGSLGRWFALRFFAGGHFSVFDFAERKFMADSSSYSFAGSEAGEREFAFRFSVEFLSDSL